MNFSFGAVLIVLSFLEIIRDEEISVSDKAIVIRLIELQHRPTYWQ